MLPHAPVATSVSDGAAIRAVRSSSICMMFQSAEPHCCGGSLRTFGNMKRPVAASAAADAAENAPQARPIQARRVSSGDRSSGSRVAGLAAAP